jgi:alkanesulfonate monooxygenase SsuD/methylene tetrahydromethanopterin reductase-like flavin-dependent oxidoreductase (luciferase family)
MRRIEAQPRLREVLVHDQDCLDEAAIWGVCLMRYGIVTANLGEYADPRLAIRLARAAEEAGWEAFFVWDHLGFVWGSASSDPWISLSAVAVSTTHLRLGTAITPLARRRPQVVANALGSLDLLSDGRTMFGAELGGMTQEFSAFGEPDAAK